MWSPHDHILLMQINQKLDEYTYDFHQDEEDEIQQPKLMQHVHELVALLEQAVYGQDDPDASGGYQQDGDDDAPRGDDSASLVRLLNILSATRDGRYSGSEGDNRDFPHKPMKKEYLQDYFAGDENGDGGDHGYDDGDDGNYGQTDGDDDNYGQTDGDDGNYGDDTQDMINYMHGMHMGNHRDGQENGGDDYGQGYEEGYDQGYEEGLEHGYEDSYDENQQGEGDYGDTEGHWHRHGYDDGSGGQHYHRQW